MEGKKIPIKTNNERLYNRLYQNLGDSFDHYNMKIKEERFLSVNNGGLLGDKLPRIRENKINIKTRIIGLT